MEAGTKAISGKIALGITEDEVALGSHLLHFWRTGEEFECGVRFLELGLADQSQFCVLFGHDEANRRVLEILRRTSDGLDRALAEERLVVLCRDSSASATLARLEEIFTAAVRKGATAIRYLGNLGMGRDPLPGRGADEVIELEHDATALTARYPCVVVCMYDLNTVSGHLVLNAGFASHPLTLWRDGLRQNPYDSSAQTAGTETPDGDGGP